MAVSEPVNGRLATGSKFPVIFDTAAKKTWEAMAAHDVIAGMLAAVTLLPWNNGADLDLVYLLALAPLSCVLDELFLRGLISDTANKDIISLYNRIIRNRKEKGRWDKLTPEEQTEEILSVFVDGIDFPDPRQGAWIKIRGSAELVTRAELGATTVKEVKAGRSVQEAMEQWPEWENNGEGGSLTLSASLRIVTPHINLCYDGQ
ncbi:hypothetical protein D9758_001854 [Tetrapyrgos nigripes]|uniref:Uncharacterized protein n=1 Tax=Tetrapyrgos nigripes TaxID=182062 RepID=A0A8H5LV64_9AGAR|nr:hypothetical protein D9758_001854 [Tetrapyrgos nigripes]